MNEDTNKAEVGTLATGVVKTLEARIRCGELAAGRALPSERELSAEFQVSRGIIRSAMQELGNLGLVLQRKGHRPVVQHLSRLPASGARNLGVWLWPYSGHFAAASILKGIQATNLGPLTQVIVASGAGEDWNSILDSERDFLESMADDPATLGVIVWYLGGERNLPSLEKLQAKRVPIVFVDRMPPVGFDMDYVATNNAYSATQAIQHLVNLGHRKIGMISNIDPASSVAEREEGYCRGLLDNGIEVRDDYIQRATYDADESCSATLDALLGLPDRPTAIFCINDTLGLLVHDILGRKGYQVPDDISVVGFDGLLRWVPGGGYLTTMRQDFERMGRIAATLVHERATGKAGLLHRHYLLDAPISLGSSTGAPKQNRPSVEGGSQKLDSTT
ncbi:MAG: substrate-binding domain-containing protein [Armatimonadetes bacterium]|nr:substrate-binding domain-containing protein [Armatimonadota bacterium]